MKKRIALIAFVSVGILGPCASAASPPPLSLIAQKSSRAGHEQIALVFDATGARLSLNSNFMERPGSHARLGLFHSSMTPALQDLKSDLERSSSTLARRDQGYASIGAKPLAAKSSPHAVEFSLSGREVRSESEVQALARDAFARIWNFADWVPDDSAEVDRNADGKSNFHYAGKSAGRSATAPVRCDPREGGAVACKIPDFGTAYLSGHP